MNIAGSALLENRPQAAAPKAASVPFAPVNHGSITLRQALLRTLQNPGKYLLQRWNWKSALLSSILRASLFFFTNLAAGVPSALAALQTELIFRGVTSGFYGALTEMFLDVSPAWKAALTVMVILPLANHSVELLVHWIRGTHNLFSSILASVVLTAFSTLFNFYVMRRGALIVGAGRHSLGADLRRLPRLTLDFLVLLSRYFLRLFSRGPGRPPFNEH